MRRIHFIGGEKGGVGKSVMSRILAQYHIDREIPFKVYDADLSHGAMMRYYADYSEAVDITKFESADQIAEQVTETGTTAIVDMAAQASKPLSRWVAETGLIELAGELGLSLTFWHVMDDGADTLMLLQNMLDAYAEKPDYVIVRNFGRGTDFSHFDASDAASLAKIYGAKVIDLPGLHPSGWIISCLFYLSGSVNPTPNPGIPMLILPPCIIFPHVFASTMIIS